MLLRTFTAADMPTAMKLVREALGDGAVILSSENHKGKKGVTLTAAVEQADDDDSGFVPLKSEKKAPKLHAKIDELRHSIQTVLRFHNVPDLFAAKMSRHTTDHDLSAMLELKQLSANGDEKQLLALALEKVACNFFEFSPLDFEQRKTRIMLVGAPGIGKTLTIAKMAAHLSLHNKTTPLVVITTDTKRAGGIEQLQAFTTILGIDLQVIKTPKDLQHYVGSLPASTQVLIDTAGCNPFNKEELQELKSFAAQKSIEPILVLPAGGDSFETIDAVENFSDMALKRILVTRTDTARRYGGILSAAAAHRLALCNMSHSPSIVDPLKPMSGAVLAQLLLRYKNN